MIQDRYGDDEESSISWQIFSIINRELLMTNIAEQERLGKRLKDQEKEITERQADRVNQVLMWKDLIK